MLVLLKHCWLWSGTWSQLRSSSGSPSVLGGAYGCNSRQTCNSCNASRNSIWVHGLHEQSYNRWLGIANSAGDCGKAWSCIWYPCRLCLSSVLGALYRCVTRFSWSCRIDRNNGLITVIFYSWILDQCSPTGSLFCQIPIGCLGHGVSWCRLCI